MLIIGLTSIAACNSDKNSVNTENSENNQTSNIETEQNVSPIKASELEANNEVALAVQQALANNDYRLLHSKGRRIVVPGLEQIELSLIESQCGIKPMPKSSDVMKTAEQKLARKAQYSFAKQFNQMMYAKCLAQKET